MTRPKGRRTIGCGYASVDEDEESPMPDAPSMNELLGADTPKNWGKWGPDDEVGALNYLV